MTSFTANPTNSSSTSTPSLAAMLAADVQPAILLRSARRVRHLDRIVLRHLDLPSFHSIMFPSHGMYYTLSRNEQHTPFYCSTIIPTTLNPSWDYVDDHQLTDIGTSAQPQARYVVDTSQPPVGTLTKIVCKIWVRQSNNSDNNNASSSRTTPSTSTSTETSTETSTSTTTSVSPSSASTPSTSTSSSPSPSPSTSSTSTSCGYTDHCILHYPINMTRLERLLPTLYLPSLPSLPPNTLLVFLVDGIYSTRDVREAVGRPIVAVPVDERMPSKKIDVNDSLISCTNLIRASTSLHHVESQVAQLCSQIEQLLQEKAQRKKKLRDAEFRRQRVRELQAIVKQEQESLTQERVRVCSFRRALLPRGEALCEQHQQLIQQTTTLEQAKLTLQYQKKIALRNATIKLEARRRKLISQLMTVYPIARSKQQPINDKVKHYTIKGIRLPTTQLATYDEEQVSTALGYVCHLVFLIAKYLDLPLRYRVMYRASRSAICDDVHANQQHIFPLYFKNTEEKRFECACILLNKNIEHLLNVRVPDWHRLAQHSQNTLENLDILLATEVPR